LAIYTTTAKISPFKVGSSLLIQISQVVKNFKLNNYQTKIEEKISKFEKFKMAARKL
jgi:uncharacterized Zn ribbon protein